MSEQKPVTKVPDGVTRFYTTRQLAPTAKGFVGYETVWKPLQKEIVYKLPKTPYVRELPRQSVSASVRPMPVDTPTTPVEGGESID